MIDMDGATVGPAESNGAREFDEEELGSLEADGKIVMDGATDGPTESDGA
jgi:hypothetical protein